MKSKGERVADRLGQLCWAALLGLFCNLLMPASGAAGQPVDVSAEQDQVELGLSVSYWAEQGQRVNLDAVQDSLRQGDWKKSAKVVPNFGFDAAPHWFHVSLQHSGTEELERLLEVGYSMLDYLDVYIVRQDTTVESYQTGDRYPFSERLIEHRHFLFPVSLEPGETVDVFLRVDTTSSLQLPIRLWERESFYGEEQAALLLQGLYFGLMLLMCIYNLFIYVSVRERVYLIYVAYVSGLVVALSVMHGFAFQFFWSESLWWQEKCTIVACGITLSFMMWFADEFLNLDRVSTHFSKLLRWLAVVSAVSSVAALVLPYSALAGPIGLLVIVGAGLSLSAGIFAWRSGVVSAKYFTFACSSLLLGAMMIGLNKTGLIARSFWTENGVQLGSAIEAVLLSLALAARINVLKAQKERAQEDALEIQREVSKRLESEVASQTRELQEKTEKLQLLNDERVRFFQNISHELRTPLTLLLAPLDKALREHGQDPSLVAAKQNALRLLRLVNQLLDFQKMSAGKMKLSDEPRDLVALVRGCAIYFSQAAAERKVDFAIDIDGTDLNDWHGTGLDWVVRGDRDALEKIVLNYLTNALKFTPAGGEICLGLEKRGVNARLFVQDTGPGIPLDEQQHLFKTFSQLDASITRRQEGTGIGLSLVKSFTELMGGRVGLESEYGHGSRFWVEFPLTDEEPIQALDMAALRAEVHVGNLSAGDFGNALRESENASEPTAHVQEVILIVDDLFDMRQHLREIFEPLGYRVITASMVTEALELARSEEPDLVITDWMMPDMSGTQFVERLRDDAVLKSTPVIMLTARADSPSRVYGTQAGANAYLVKPCDQRELLHTAENLLLLRRSERDRAISGRQQLLGQLSVELAHGLNNPLNFISGGVVNLRSIVGEVDKVLKNLLSTAEKTEQVRELTQFFEAALGRHETILSIITKGTTESGNVVEDIRRLAEADGRVLETVSLEELFTDELSTLRLSGGQVYEHVRYDIQFPDHDLVVANPFVLRQVVQSVMHYCTEQACRLKHEPVVKITFMRDGDGSLLIRSMHNGEVSIGAPSPERELFGLDVSSRLAFARTLWEAQGGNLRLIEQGQLRLELYIPHRVEPT